MSTHRPNLKPLGLVLALALTYVQPVHADERESLETLRLTTQALLDALVEQGVLTREKADALIRTARDKAQAQAGASRAAEPANAAAGKPDVTADGKPVLRIPYVPESVRAQIRDQVKEEVVAQARAERWGVPSAPSWINNIKIEGDIRVRHQRDGADSANTPASTYVSAEVLNANGLTRMPDFAGYAANALGLQPTTDTAASRSRDRLRMRLGLTAKVADEVGVGIRLATGSATDRVSTNQTMGQNFNKYQLFVDRAYLRLDPAEWVSIQGGRIPNPWFSTEMVWNENLNFEGYAATFRRPEANDGVSPFLTLGYFPLRESAPPARNGRSLFGVQAGTGLELGSRTRVKLGMAYYHYRNIEGRSDPNYTVLAGSVPTGLKYGSYEYPSGMRQRGNTVFETNPLLAGSLDTNPVWGLAYRFKPFVLTATAELTHFSPFNILLAAELVRNLAFSQADFHRRADPAFYGNVNPGGRSRGYQLKMAVGDTEVRGFNDWQVQFAYRRVGSDAVLDSFTDSDLGLGGTNLQGYSVGLNYGLYRNTSVGVRYLAARSLDTTLNANYPDALYKVNSLQVDFNVRF